MRELAFSKWSPGGNTTLFFPEQDVGEEQQAALAREALEQHNLGGEQVGFINVPERRLRMAGGEFCVNASRAFGALLAMAAEKKQSADGGALPEHREEIHVSGWPGALRLTARGATPLWDVEAHLHLPPCPVEKIADGAYLVRLPGIVHLLLHSEMHPFPDDCLNAAAQLRRTHGLEDCPASGVIWWRECQGKLEVLPLVHVRRTRTTCLENACGSGTLALALALSGLRGDRLFSVVQPGGSALEVSLSDEGENRAARISGPVALVAQGRVWLAGETA
ncbi:MAG: hypothetical protein LBR31_08685 [Desulfovibrio sp.]|jgi:hypothetical protein|nr:hypothetical protein [Desulfovibrio sp.]